MYCSFHEKPVTMEMYYTKECPICDKLTLREEENEKNKSKRKS